MQKEIIEGIPYWKDKHNTLFSFEPDKKNLLELGTYNPATEVLNLKVDWLLHYQPKLTAYREGLKQRERKENKSK
jgi:hypothetical protein